MHDEKSKIKIAPACLVRRQVSNNPRPRYHFSSTLRDARGLRDVQTLVFFLVVLVQGIQRKDGCLLDNLRSPELGLPPSSALHVLYYIKSGVRGFTGIRVDDYKIQVQGMTPLYAKNLAAAGSLLISLFWAHS